MHPSCANLQNRLYNADKENHELTTKAHAVSDGLQARDHARAIEKKKVHVHAYTYTDAHV